MNLAVALRLGRVSNLPTVWTNALAGIVLAGGHVADRRTLPLIVAFSLFYVAGMYLNDAYDAGIDARERPERPIPSGRVSVETVFTIGFAMMALGLALLAWTGYGGATGTGLGAVMGGLGLGAAIVLYNRRHKDNPLSPVLMGICRVLVYVTAGLAVALELPTALWVGAFLLLCYLIGLTYVAKQETLGEVRNLWPLLFLGAPARLCRRRRARGPDRSGSCCRLRALGRHRALVPVAPAAGRRAARRGEPDRRHLAARRRADRWRRRSEHRLAGGRRLCAHARPAAVRAGHLKIEADAGAIEAQRVAAGAAEHAPAAGAEALEERGVEQGEDVAVRAAVQHVEPPILTCCLLGIGRLAADPVLCSVYSAVQPRTRLDRPVTPPVTAGRLDS